MAAICLVVTAFCMYELLQDGENNPVSMPVTAQRLKFQQERDYYHGKCSTALQEFEWRLLNLLLEVFRNN